MRVFFSFLQPRSCSADVLNPPCTPPNQARPSQLTALGCAFSSSWSAAAPTPSAATRADASCASRPDSRACAAARSSCSSFTALAWARQYAQLVTHHRGRRSARNKLARRVRAGVVCRLSAGAGASAARSSRGSFTAGARTQAKKKKKKKKKPAASVHCSHPPPYSTPRKSRQ